MAGFREVAEPGTATTGFLLSLPASVNYLGLICRTASTVRHAGGRIRLAWLAGAAPVRDVWRDELRPPGASGYWSSHALRERLDRHPAQPVRRRLDRRVRQREQPPEVLREHADDRE